jgi:hypothetical protein
MAGNRTKAQAIILDGIEALCPGSPNTAIYKKLFDDMSDTQFGRFIDSLDDGAAKLAIISPNLGKFPLSVERNLGVARLWGHEFFQQVWMEGQDGSPDYLSVEKYLVIDLPLRRQAQLLVKKISIPEDNKSVDNLTGQPTGKSKGSKISFPEMQIMLAQGLDQSVKELMKVRGGDEKAFRAMNDSIAKTGGASLAALDSLNTRVKSTETLRSYLTAAHLENTL